MPNLADRLHCTGCAACYNSCARNAIQMVPDVEGFLFPDVDLKSCVNCGLCEKVCPALNQNNDSFDVIPDAYAVWSYLDREKSSSGGAFSAFARYVLGNSGIVYGAAFYDGFNVRHVAVDSLEKLDRLRGSKYIQSSIGDVFKQVRTAVRNERQVLFCGTPCQVDGLKKFLTKDYDNLITLDLACHGVPSYKVFESYIEKLAKKKNLDKSDINGFEFRKRDGWDKTPYVYIKNKKTAVYGVDALFTEAFDAASIFRKSCYSCKYAKFPRVGDCTIADFWGIGLHGRSFLHDTSKGVSLVITNTKKGNNFLRNLKDVFIQKRTLEEALVENDNLNHCVEVCLQRDSLIHAFLDSEMTLECIDNNFSVVDLSLKARIKQYTKKCGLYNLAKSLYRKTRMLKNKLMVKK